MADVAHQIGSDFQLSATGGLLLASGSTETQQRVLRRLLTSSGDYIWNLSYGGGLPAMVGLPVDAAAIRNAIRAQIFQEAAVAQAPPPVVDVTSAADGTVTATITYTDATTGQTNILTVPVS